MTAEQTLAEIISLIEKEIPGDNSKCWNQDNLVEKIWCMIIDIRSKNEELEMLYSIIENMQSPVEIR